MNKPSQHIPFYKQMIALLQIALDVLDEQGREEVLQFLIGQQNADGGFNDRGGRPDLYYSLFGGMMLRAVNPLNPPKGDLPKGSNTVGEIGKLQCFVAGQKENPLPGFIEKCCLVLLQKEFEAGRFSRRKAILPLGRSFWKSRRSINASYRSFVLFLTLDAVFPFFELLKVAAKRMLNRTTIDSNSPCSEVAARVFLKKMLDQDGTQEQRLLKSYACESGGFKAFQHLWQADMLSTAVALFALNFAGCDLRLLKPACLGFIQSNYSEGAFLSGNGDPTADVEHTFYGLLALGVLAG